MHFDDPGVVSFCDFDLLHQRSIRRRDLICFVQRLADFDWEAAMCKAGSTRLRKLLRVEGYSEHAPQFTPFIWNSTLPTDRGEGCPFAPSTHFKQVQLPVAAAGFVC